MKEMRGEGNRLALSGLGWNTTSTAPCCGFSEHLTADQLDKAEEVIQQLSASSAEKQ